MTRLPYGGYKVKVAPSSIEGLGLFATADISPDEVIAPGRIDGMRTIAGRYTNHAKNPNARAVKRPGGNIDLVAVNAIRGCMGGLDGEEITVDYRQVVAENGKEV
jgi:SET domain-containing protein